MKINDIVSKEQQQKNLAHKNDDMTSAVAKKTRNKEGDYGVKTDAVAKPQKNMTDNELETKNSDILDDINAEAKSLNKTIKKTAKKNKQTLPDIAK